MTSIRIGLLLWLLLTGVVTADAQQRRQDGGQQYVFFETINLPSENPEMGRLEINYRIIKNFFVFLRTNDPSAPLPFSGRGEVIIELFDRDGRSAGRDIADHTLYSESHRQELSDLEYLEGLFSFELPPGEYRLYIQVVDQQSARKFTDQDRRARVRAYPENKFSAADPIVLSDENKEHALKPLNLSGNVLFGRNFQVYLEYIFDTSQEGTSGIPIRIFRMLNDRGARELVYSDSIPGDWMLHSPLLTRQKHPESYSYVLETSQRADKKALRFMVPGERFREGVYRLEVDLGHGPDSFSVAFPFRVVWLDKPISLRNLDFAISMLEYILPEEEYREFRRGSDAQKQERFYSYWRSKDPDSTTAFNPVLSEYYARVDYTAREFQTLREQNGATTDRGKVYIIYGPPTETQRLLTAGQAPQEIWLYTHLNQKFIFVDQARQGNYRLVGREDI